MLNANILKNLNLMIGVYFDNYVEEVVPFSAEEILKMKDSDLVLDVTMGIYMDSEPLDYQIFSIDEIYHNPEKNQFGINLNRVASGKYNGEYTISFDFNTNTATSILDTIDLKFSLETIYIIKFYEHYSNNDLLDLKTKNNETLDYLKNLK